AAGGPMTRIPLKTVSRVGTFDAWVSLLFGDTQHSASASLIVDSGAHTMTVPSFDAIKALPNFDAHYKILSESIREPFQCQAKLLRGPIILPTETGRLIIKECDFFACTGPNAEQQCTAIFGTGWISQTEVFTDESGNKFTVRPPLTYGD